MTLVIMEYLLYVIAFLSLICTIFVEGKSSFLLAMFIGAVVLLVGKYIYMMIKEVRRHVHLMNARQKNSCIMLPIKDVKIIKFNDLLNKQIFISKSRRTNESDRKFVSWNKEYKISLEYQTSENRYILSTIFYASDSAINFFEYLIKSNIITTIKVWGSEIEKKKIFEFDMDKFCIQANKPCMLYEFQEKYTKINKIRN